LFGIASAISNDIQEFATSREAAERTVTEILRDEPDLEGLIWVEPVTLLEPSLN